MLLGKNKKNLFLKYLWIYLVVLFNYNLLSAFVYTDSSIIHLNKLWKYHKGDNLKWADVNFNDSQWEYIDTHLNLDEIPKDAFTGICWFRTKVVIDSNVLFQPIGMIVNHLGASEIYVDGKLAHRFGKVGLDKETEQAFYPNNIPIGITFDNRKVHIIAIRYSNQHYQENYKKYDAKNAGISISAEELNKTIEKTTTLQSLLILVFGLLSGILLALGDVHLLLFLFYKKHKANLYYSFFTYIFSVFFFSVALMTIIKIPAIQIFIKYYIFLYQIRVQRYCDYCSSSFYCN